MVFNDSRVLPARLSAEKSEHRRKVEILIIEAVGTEPLGNTGQTRQAG